MSDPRGVDSAVEAASRGPRGSTGPASVDDGPAPSRIAQLLAVALVASAPLVWWMSTEVVRVLHEGSVPFLRDRLFRARAEFDLDFYLTLTRPSRLVTSAAPIFLATLVTLSELLTSDRSAGQRARAFRSAVVRANAWMPTAPVARTLIAASSGMFIALAAGYRAVPSLGNDVVTYIVAARKQFDPSYLVGDLPIRDPDPALRAWGVLVRMLSALAGFEGAFLAISLLGAALLFVAIQRLVTDVLGASAPAGFLAGVFGLVLTFGEFGYTLSVPSHAAFFPTPRFAALAIAVLAVGFLLQGALIRGVALGLLATALNTLDGLIPVGLCIVALLVVRVAGVRAGRVRAGAGQVFLVAVAGLTLAVLLDARVVALLPSTPWSPVIVVTGGALLVLTGLTVAGTAKDDADGLPSPFRLLAAGGVLSAGGVLLAGQRAVGSEAGFLESVIQFETILRGVRQGAGMLILSATDTASAVLFVALVMTAVGLASLRPLQEADGAGRRTREHVVAVWSVLVLLLVAVGGLLMEFTQVPFLVTIWPLRPAWVVVLGAVVLIAVHLDRASLRLGAMPALAFGLIVLNGPVIGRATWGALLFLGASLLVLSRHRTGGMPSASGTTSPPGLKRDPGSSMGRVRRMAGVGALLAPSVVLLVVVLSVPRPETRVVDSMDRLEREGSERTVEIVQMARAAAETTPDDARILIPLDAAWGSFRLLSGRGGAFEWKNFSTAQPGLWYSQLRWMCDPDYELGPDEDFSIGLPAVKDCHEGLDLQGLRRVAEAFGATHAIVRADHVQNAEILGVTESGRFALVRLE